LRRFGDLGKYIHKTTPVSHLKFFASLYFIDEFNFIIETLNGKPIGTISVYRIDKYENSAELGRWICIGSPAEKVESLKLAFRFAFETAQLKRIYCHTRSENLGVAKLHHRLPYSSKQEIFLEDRKYLCTSLNEEDWINFDDFLMRLTRKGQTR
jgi:RimJ/RimL family protein N-acetyltransferase